MAMMRGEKMPKKAGKKKVSEIRIMPGEKGSMTVHHRLHPDMQRRPGGGMMPMHSPMKQQAFTSQAEAQPHVNDLMSQLEPEPEGGNGGMY